MTAPFPSFAAQDLAIGYNTQQSLIRGLNQEFAAGDLVVLLGPNGSGKSTCLRTLAGLMAPLQGRITLDGQDLLSWSARERARRLAVVFTAMPAVSDLRVRDFLLLGRYPHRDAWGRDPGASAAFDLAVETLLLAALLERPLYRLSDGERQRALLGRALVQASPIVLLDEPTHYLDPAQAGRIHEMLESLAQHGERTLMVATHDVAWALRAASRIGLLHNGRVNWYGAGELAAQTHVLETAFRAPGMRFDAQLGRFIIR